VQGSHLPEGGGGGQYLKKPKFKAHGSRYKKKLVAINKGRGLGGQSWGHAKGGPPAQEKKPKKRGLNTRK